VDLLSGVYFFANIIGRGVQFISMQAAFLSCNVVPSRRIANEHLFHKSRQDCSFWLKFTAHEYPADLNYYCAWISCWFKSLRMDILSLRMNILLI